MSLLKQNSHKLTVKTTRGGTSDMKEIELEVSLEEGRIRRVADILEMGGSENVSETIKETWVTNIWKVP
jgi:hypothetical protein